MPLRIGELAERAGVGVPTIRYYERRGLVRRPPRTRAGYRQYPEEEVARDRFVKRAQELGFSLEEIRELLALRVRDGEACGAVEARARAKLAQVEAKLRELEALRRVLGRLVAACRARRPTGECPILELLEEPVAPAGGAGTGAASGARGRS